MRKFFLGLVLFVFLVGCSSINVVGTPTKTVSPASAPGQIAEGTVLETGANVYIISDLDHPSIVLRMTEKSTIWEGITWVAQMPAEKGDFVIASGVWGQDQTSFTVQNIYINLVNIMGTVKTVDDKNLKFNLSDFRQGDITVLVYPHTRILQNGDLGPNDYQAVHTLPQPGKYVEVVGRKVEDGNVIAVNLTMQ